MHMSPDEIERCRKLIRQYAGKSAISQEQKMTLYRAQLKMAMWVCAQEGLKPNRRNLSAILGPEAPEVLRHLPTLLSASSAGGGGG